MSATLPLSVLVAPFVIAATAIAMMAALSGSRAPRRLVSELGYKPDPAQALSLTAARYVGGHPELGFPVPRPFMLLTDRHLAVFARKWGVKLFMIPWEKVELISVLDRQQLDAAALAVRGLAPGAIAESAANGWFLRVRYEDERQWWQNVIFELPAALGQNQAQEIERFWMGLAKAGLPLGAQRPQQAS
jgi:hypothetical protein